MGTGFGLLDDAVIDQHFQNRNRLKRLQGVLTRHPNHWGLGIDEDTAVVVEGHTGTVMGKANVRVCLPTTVRKLEPVQVLEAGDQFDLDALRQAVLLGQLQEPLRDLIGQLGSEAGPEAQ